MIETISEINITMYLFFVVNILDEHPSREILRQMCMYDLDLALFQTSFTS